MGSLQRRDLMTLPVGAFLLVALAMVATAAPAGSPSYGTFAVGNGAYQRLQELSTAVKRASDRHLGAPQAVLKTYNLTMRDEIKLFTIVADLNKPGRYPCVIVRSPYGPDGTENLNDLYLPFGFVVVQQNQRGTGDSGGNFTFWATAPADEADTIAWIVQQDWSNGDVYVMGASADGINMIEAMRQPQQEKGQWAIFALGIGYEASFINGALREALGKGWLKHMQEYRPWLPNYYTNVLLPHEAYSQWWEDRTLMTYENIDFKGVFWAGWYDIFLQPMIETWGGYNFRSSAQNQQRLVIGPRGHCLTSFPLLFPDDRLADIWSYETSLSIFMNGTLNAELHETHSAVLRDAAEELVGPGRYRSAKDLDMVSLYIMGPSRYSPPSLETLDQPEDTAAEARNVTGLYWTTLPSFPNTTAYNLYLRPDGRLTEGPSLTPAELSYTYDPRNPVPSLGGNNLEIACGPLDQRKSEDRPDVLLFETIPLPEDTAVVGRISVTLFVKSNCSDTDFTVKVTDVYPLVRGNASILIQDSIIRMRWRNGIHQPPMNMTAGQMYEVKIDLWPTAYIFNQGHRIRLAVSSSNYPRFTATPNNGWPLAEEGPIYIANNTILMGGSLESRVTLPLVPLSAIPPNIAPDP